MNLYIYIYICSNISATPDNGLFVSQLNRCSASSWLPSWILLSFYRVCVTNDFSFVLIADHFIGLRSWICTMCDIWSVIGVSSM